MNHGSTYRMNEWEITQMIGREVQRRLENDLPVKYPTEYVGSVSLHNEQDREGDMVLMEVRLNTYFGYIIKVHRINRQEWSYLIDGEQE